MKLGAITLVLLGLMLGACDGVNEKADVPAQNSVSVNIEELRSVETFIPDQACKLAAEIKLKDFDLTSKMGDILQGDNSYSFDVNGETGVSKVVCSYNDAAIVGMLVDDKPVNPINYRSTFLKSNSYLPITESAHLAGSRVDEAGGLLAYYVILTTEPLQAGNCLFMRYKATTPNEDSMFVSVDGAPFENLPLNITSEGTSDKMLELPANDDGVVIRVKHREMAMVYGFEIKSCN